MRRIVSQQETDKKKKKRQVFIGGFLIIIMLLSTAGYAFTQFFGKSNTNNEQIVYKGITFIKQNNLWLASIQGVQLGFVYNPVEVGSINTNLNLTIGDYYQQPLYIYSENQNVEQELYRNLDSFVLRRQYACPEGESNCPKDFPIKTCLDNFIIIKESNSTGIIRQQGKCVFIEGKPEDLVKTIDAFLFHIFGVQ